MKQEIEIPVGFEVVNVFYDGKIRVALRELKPVYKLGDVLTNGLQIWIRDINGEAVILLDGKNIWLKIQRSDLGAEVRYANYDERCKFFEALVKFGYKWNSKKLKLSKPEPKFKRGDFLVVESTNGRKFSIRYLSGRVDRINKLIVSGTLTPALFVSTGTFAFREGDRVRLANMDERREYLDAAYKAGCLQFR